jgi:hypothetical protein
MNLFLMWLISFYQWDILPLFKKYISPLEVFCKIVYIGHNGCSFSNVLKLKPKIGLNGFKNLDSWYDSNKKIQLVIITMVSNGKT